MPLREVICPICGKLFKTYHPTQRFCSLKCFNENRKVPKIKLTCVVCGKTWEDYPSHSWRKYCSRECYAKAQRLRITARKTKKLGAFKCKFCGKEFQRYWNPEKDPKPMYCSRSCSGKAKKKHMVYKRWRGKRTEKRKRLNERKNASCEVCGFKRLLDICHIVPAKKGGAYDRINILFLCPNHHYLFDRGKLTKEEFSKIADKVKEAYDYFHYHGPYAKF